MPDNYWGVGYDAGNRTASPDETTRYHRRWFSAEGKVVHRINKSLFIGITYDFNSTKATEINDYMQSDDYVQKYGSSATNFGLGLTIDLDKRDNVQNPYKGYLFSVSFVKYNTIFKIADSNEFLKSDTGVPENILIWVIAEYGLFNLKLNMETVILHGWILPQLGTQFDLRGYQWGRFRDKITSFAITEYRHMFSGMRMPALKKYVNHLGFVVWSGIGNVTSRYDEMRDFLPNVGAGLRVEIQPRMNLRVDYGVAKDKRALYVTFSEAF